ncbi:FecR family protein [Methylomicrobium sp. Wu6]|uniref:FecR family protein n=1 Tax=Methylomicrobium sp. Wu6 TaxID=3107928 RepID=UPI002DD623BE|nr:FecR family protein [Methylomicrobium sp. Wu6]MEC4748537.1 FecR family protein [Methylomicrobium sp. Wu6]
MTLSQPEQNAAEREAMEWQAQLSSDRLSEAQRLAFENWLTQSAENAAAWRAVNDFWNGLDGVSLDDLGTDTAAPPQKIRPLRPKQHHWRTGLALAASVLLLVGLIDPEFDSYLADYRSATGQQRQVALEDGSTLLLNTASAVSVDYSPERRLVTLHSGEAFFTVAANPGRPFIVQTEAGQVQALGTAFDVKREGETAFVTVFEHAVKVTNRSGAVKGRLVEGERLQFNGDRLEPAGRIDLQRAAAWHRRRMVFQDRPLAEVVAELDRYRPGKLLIISAAIEKLPITGVFGIADTDVALASIEQSLPVSVRKLPGGLVLLSAR